MDETVKNQMTTVTVEELISHINLVMKVNAISERVHFQYMTMLEFIESRGLKSEWDDYLLGSFLKNQNPVGN